MSDALVRRPTELPRSISPAELAALRVREFLAFVVNDETFALPLQAVREILKPPPVTPVPRAKHEVIGIISVRGRITTVLDLRRRLRVAERPSGKHTRVLLVDGGDEVLGLLVDRVLQVYRLTEEEIEVAGVVGGDLSEHVYGIGRPRGGAQRSSKQMLDEEEILILLEPGPLLRR